MFKKVSIIAIFCVLTLLSGVVFGATVGDGITLYNSGKYEDAIKIFNSVISANSKDAIAYHYKGLSYIQLRKDSEAAESLLKAISINPSYTKPYMDLVLCYERLGKYEEALSVVNNLITVDSQYKDVYFEQAKIYNALGKYQESIASFKKQRGIDASNLWSSLYVSVGLMKQEDYESALNDLTLIEKFDTNKYNTAMIKAKILEESGLTDEAIDLILNSKVLYKDNKGNTQTQDFNLAWYDYKTGNYSKAVQASTRELINKSLKPSNGYFNLARIYADRGQFADVTVALKRALYHDANVKILIMLDPIFQEYIASAHFKALDENILMVDGSVFSVENSSGSIPIIVKNNTIMMPILTSPQSPINIFERLGAKFDYNQDTMVMTITKGSKVLKFDINSKSTSLNDKNLNLVQHAMVQGRYIYIPLESALKELGIPYSYNKVTKILDINNFTDVPQDSWYSNELGIAANKGIVKGFSDNTFRPSVNVTIDQFLVMTLNTMGHTNIKTASPYWAQNYIDKALELGYIRSNEFTNYKAVITREQAAAIISRALNLDTVYESTKYEAMFSDFSSISALYKSDVLKTYANGILTLSSGKFNPKGNVNRAAAVMIIAKLTDESRRTMPILP